MKNFAAIMFLLLDVASSFATELAQFRKIHSFQASEQAQITYLTRYVIVSRMSHMKPYVVDLENNNQIVYTGASKCVEIEISNNGKYLTEAPTAQECYDGEGVSGRDFKLFDLEKKQVVYQHEGRRSQFSFDSRYITFEANWDQPTNFTHLLEIETGILKEKVCTYPWFGNHITNDRYAKISKNNQFIACPRLTNKVVHEIREITSGRLTASIERYTFDSSINRAFSFDGRFHFETDMDVRHEREPVILDLNSGGSRIDLPKDEGNIYIAWSTEDSQYMVFEDVVHVYDDGNSISRPVYHWSIFDVQLSKRYRFLKTPEFRTWPLINSQKKMFYSLGSDYSWRAYSFDGRELWRTGNIYELPVPSIVGMGYSNDGTTLIVGSRNKVDMKIHDYTLFQVVPPQSR